MADRRKLICVIDDDLSVRRALGRLLASFGFEVQLMASARECLDTAHIDRASALIVDVNLPGMDAFELHTLLRESGRDVPTIMVSGLNDSEHRARAQAIGVVAFLKKPWGEDLMRDALDRAVNQDASNREPV